MPIEVDMLAYHRSVGEQLITLKDRVRNLIGDRHWPTDGEYKEAALRKVLREHLPEVYNVGRGFVCSEGEASRQIDILVAKRSKPTLFKDGDLFMVTPDVPSHLIEVKTKLSGEDTLLEALTSLADNVERVRRTAEGRHCWAGLFAYEGGLRTPDRVLRCVSRAVGDRRERVINCIALGNNSFVRFWTDTEAEQHNEPGQGWSYYSLTANAEGLAFGYFISNAVWSQEATNPESARRAWFPLIGGKSPYRKKFQHYFGD